MAALTAMLTALVCALMPSGPVGRSGSAFDPMTSTVALSPTKRVSSSGDRELADPERDRHPRRQDQRPPVVASPPRTLLDDQASASPRPHRPTPRANPGTSFALHGLPAARGPPRA